MSKVVGEDMISLYLLLVMSHVEDVWEGREAIDFMGQTLFVVARSGLIKMKRQAGRPQDLPISTGWKMKEVDMSLEAITKRLRQAS